MNRSAAPQHPAPARVATNGGVTPSGGGKKGGRWQDSPMWLRVVWIVLLFSATILAVSLVALLYFGDNSNEAKNVDKNKQQAVFLTSGQVYFGKIKSINKDYLDLRGIYYLNVNQQVQPKDNKDAGAQSNISLVKLGCELHGPVDQMIINRDQITFWENLKTDGQVTTAIGEWVKQNPKGQQCQTASSSNATSSNQ